MGPSMAKNNTAEKEKEFLACIDNVYDQSLRDNRGIQLLKDGRIICYDTMKKIKIYKYIDKKFMLDLEFEIEDGIRSVTCLYEVEENIIILGSYMKLFLYDIRNNEAKLLQKFEYDNMSVFDQIIKLSNGLIAAAFFNVIIFYKYDEENKKLEKKDEIKTRGSIKKIYETKNGNLISFETDEIISFGKDKSIQFKMTTTNLIHYYDVIDDKYILISRINQQYEGKNFVDVYDIKKMILMQTFETKYQLFEFIKLNDNLIIASDVFGNIHELNIDENDKLSLRDIFRASDYKITKIIKFDNNKILSIDQDGDVKLWEFN
jgi:WD40 repeat protein